MKEYLVIFDSITRNWKTGEDTISQKFQIISCNFSELPEELNKLLSENEIFHERKKAGNMSTTATVRQVITSE